MAGNIITCINDNQKYFEQLQVLLCSLYHNSPEQKIKTHLVNCPSSYEDVLKKINPNVTVSIDRINLPEDVRGFMVCYRSKIIKDELFNESAPVAWFDTDILVRNDLSGFWADILPTSLKIKYRKNEIHNKSKFQAGVFVVGSSPQTKKYINEWNIKVQNRQQWYADQELLYTLYQKYLNDIDLIEMPRTYNDVGSQSEDCFFDDSIIWHSKSSHLENEKFKNEYLYYLNKVKESK